MGIVVLGSLTLIFQHREKVSNGVSLMPTKESEEADFMQGPTTKKRCDYENCHH